ncbi:hypothetical protein C0989_007126, partial [Termitomyces sp. Mn162]
TSGPLPLQPHLPGAPTNAPLTCPNLSLPTAPSPANSNTSLANSDTSLANPHGPLANSNMYPVGPITSPSPPKPLDPSNTVPDPRVCH